MIDPDKEQKITEIIIIAILSLPNSGNVSYDQAKVFAQRAARMILELDILI